MTTRNAQGSGSIFWDEARNTWVGMLSLKTAEGKRIRPVVYGVSRKEVQAKMDEKRAEFQARQASGVLTSTDTVEAVFARYMLDHQGKDSTKRFYEDKFRLYIQPVLRSVVFSDLTVQHIDLVTSNMRATGHSPRLQKMAYDVMRQLCNWATGKRLISKDRNPMDGATLPKAPRVTFDVWTAQDCQRFLAAAEDHRLYALFRLALDTGMRQGEILGLQWSDIDLENQTISIHRTLVERAGKVVGTSIPKSEAGLRTVSFGAGLKRALVYHRAQMLKEGLAANPFVFVTTEGTHILKTNLTRTFDTLIEAAGVTRIRFHDLRHTNATLLIASGESPKTVQGRLGHSTIQLTLDTYAKFTKAADTKAASVMDSVLTSAR